MKAWTYTDSVYDFIEIQDEKFKLNTAYDNIFRLMKYLGKSNNLETFLDIMFFEKDHKRLTALTENWHKEDYISLVEFITREYISDCVESNNQKKCDILKDSELIFASFYFDYNISLIEKKGKMTWKEFLILFSNLSENSPLGKAITLCSTPDKELTAESRKLKRQRNKMLNGNIDINKQLDTLTKFLKATAKR